LQVLSTHRVLQHRARAVVALLALALVAAALVACGGSGGSSSGGSSGDAQTLLKQTFTGTHDIKSGKANVQIGVDIQGGSSSIPSPIKLAISGPFQTAGTDQLPKFDLALDVNAGGQGLKAGLTSTSDKLYVNFGGRSYEVPAQLLDQLKASYKKSQQQSSSKPQLSLSGLGLDPLSWLKDPTVQGTESIGGVDTQHISAQVNVSALLDDVDKLLAKVKQQGSLPGAAGQRIPSSIPSSARTQIEDAVKTATIDIWTGKDDHTLRKATLALHVEPPKSASGPKSLDLNLSIELTDLNQPQTITPPSSSRPLSELLGQFQGLLGGALGGASGLGSGSSGSSGSGSGNAAKAQAYGECLQKAAGDATKMQDCQSLLTN
jgi:hypothetical protein